MSLKRCKEEVSYREYRVWQEHFKLQDNEPSRSDYYLMQIAGEVHRDYLKNKRKLPPLEKFKIKFTHGGKPILTDQQKKNQTDMVKAVWFIRTRYKKNGS